MNTNSTYTFNEQGECLNPTEELSFIGKHIVVKITSAVTGKGTVMGYYMRYVTTALNIPCCLHSYTVDLEEKREEMVEMLQNAIRHAKSEKSREVGVAVRKNPKKSQEEVEAEYDSDIAELTKKKEALEKIVKITCKWEDKMEKGKMLYRETFVDNKTCCGYMFLRGDEVLSSELLQRVCAQGQKVYKPCK